MTSARAALDLIAAGIPNVRALKGGWGQWAADHNPVETGERKKGGR
jgi:3-mercaptopyruvate sulfurtransferase SseA